MFAGKVIYPYPFPYHLAFITGCILHSRLYCILLYLNIATLIRYIHIFHPWQLENLGKSDTFISNLIFYTAGLACLLSSGYLTWSGYNSFPNFFMHKCFNTPCAFKDKSMWILLLAIGAATNIAVKLKLWHEKFNQINSDHEGKAKRMEFVITAVIVATIAVSIVLVVSGIVKDPMIKRLMASAANCFVLPMSFVALRPKMRKFIVTQFERRLGRQLDVERNVATVHPKLDI